MDRLKGLQAVEVAAYKLRELYLGDRAGDELATANTPVPVFLAEISEALHTAREFLSDEWQPWGRQVIGFHADGAIRLETQPNYAPAP